MKKDLNIGRGGTMEVKASNAAEQVKKPIKQRGGDLRTGRK